MNKGTLRIMAAIASALWATALVLPALYLPAGGLYTGTYAGFVVMLVGPLAITQGVFSWYANIYWAYATFQMANGRPPNFYLSGANGLLAGSFLLGFRTLGDSEYSVPKIGAWIWLISFAPSVIAGMVTALRQSLQGART